MPEDWCIDDAELATALAGAVREARAVPARFRLAALAAYGWRTLDAELATLAHDSAAATATVRAAREDLTRDDVARLRDLTFVATDLTVEVEVGARRLLGQVVPPGPGRVELHTRDGHRALSDIDASGCFSFRPLSGGCFRLHLCTAGGARVITEWVGVGPEDSPG